MLDVKSNTDFKYDIEKDLIFSENEDISFKS